MTDWVERSATLLLALGLAPPPGDSRRRAEGPAEAPGESRAVAAGGLSRLLTRVWGRADRTELWLVLAGLAGSCPHAAEVHRVRRELRAATTAAAGAEVLLAAVHEQVRRSPGPARPVVLSGRSVLLVEGDADGRLVAPEDLRELARCGGVLRVRWEDDGSALVDQQGRLVLPRRGTVLQVGTPPTPAVPALVGMALASGCAVAALFAEPEAALFPAGADAQDIARSVAGMEVWRTAHLLVALSEEGRLQASAVADIAVAQGLAAPRVVLVEAQGRRRPGRPGPGARPLLSIDATAGQALAWSAVGSAVAELREGGDLDVEVLVDSPGPRPWEAFLPGAPARTVAPGLPGRQPALVLCAPVDGFPRRHTEWRRYGWPLLLALPSGAGASPWSGAELASSARRQLDAAEHADERVVPPPRGSWALDVLAELRRVAP